MCEGLHVSGLGDDEDDRGGRFQPHTQASRSRGGT